MGKTLRTDIRTQETKIKVLLVDDQLVVRRGLEMRLSLEGDIIVVGAVEDGCQAVDAVGKLHPDVVIMDYNMPEMDGIQATEVITSLFPEISVIILSIEDNPGIYAEALKAGAKAFVAKRHGTDRLLSEIRGAAEE
jgi:DNA-binding NarL/FixJ family response regulator